MAELTPTTHWSTTQTRSQFAAIAWLRWRIFVNSRRRKGGTSELIASIIIYLIFGSFAFLVVAGTGIGAWALASHGHLHRTSWVLWAIFVVCQLLNIQLGQPGTTFDPTQLIRFPLRVDTYTSIRLFFGLLSPANIIGTLMSLAVAIGIGIATPSLWVYALIALAIFAAANVLFSRMIFAWVDRWLSTRRAREVFTGLIFLFSLGIQWANFTYNPAYNHHHTNHSQAFNPDNIDAASRFYHRAQPFIRLLPPELTANSLLAASHAQQLAFVELSFGCALFALAFLAVFTLRMRSEFRGENLSDRANAVATQKVAAYKTPSTHINATTPTSTAAPTTPKNASNFGIPPIVSVVFAKEFLYVRRNTGIFYSIVAPIVLVFIFASKLATGNNATWIFPAAIAYTLLGISPLSFNSFGLEATGAQFYFLAPVRMRDIFLAKNLMNFALALVEIVVVFGIISYIAKMPSLQTILVALLWAASTLLLSTTLGNRRSIMAPKKVNMARSAGKQASPLSGLISMGVLMLSAAIGAGLLFLATYLHRYWMLVPIFAIFAAIALLIYMRSLQAIDRIALNHREELFLELCKKD